MKALTLMGHGGLEQLEVRTDLPTPVLRDPHDVLVRVHAGALNHLDLFVVAGLPGVTVTPPWIVGCDAAGEVEAVGSAVTRLKPGDHVIVNPGVSDGTCEYCLAGEQPLCPRYRIYGEHIPGLLAEHVVIPERNVLAIPDSISWNEAAAFPLATLTAWRMVVTRAKVQQGDDVLIWGIGGGVALQALQICKYLGARVWVTSGSDKKLERARALGADETLNHRSLDVAREVRQRTGKRGVNVVLDNVGQETWKASLLALGKAGRLVTCGGTSGPMVETDIRRLFWNQWTIMGSTMGNDAEFEAITAHLRDGRFLPVVDSVRPLEEGRAAYARLQAGEQFGKVVLRVS